ncbi:hypothetical protein AB733_23825 [Photobacterium swingsii]|uniref:NERD domain-containing protein n=1 Tax=Photobacterium swingsii TaxID=680026 RepID=A0A0J8XSR7_9GAMM|nr:hypothetical protein [Photobacterium swingsii]KMV28409.1 hypothetical protein AB733_23825 [Photobacterium swingsii]PSW18879.1 hypothetical protein C9I94_24245 [Photobacterium swingsii]
MKKSAKKPRKINKRNLNKKKKPSHGGIKNTKSDNDFVTYNVPNPLRDLSDEQREEFLSKMIENAKEQTSVLIDDIVEIFKKVDPISLIAILSMQALVTGVTKEGDLVEKKDGIHQYHIEILQAIFLCIPNEELGYFPPTPNVTDELTEKITSLGSHANISRFPTSINDTTTEEKAIESIQVLLRTSTQSIRNWSYQDKMKNLTSELYSKLEVDINNNFEFKPNDVISLFEVLMNSIQDRVDSWLDVIQELRKSKNKNELIPDYCKLMGFDSDYTSSMMSDSQLDIPSMKKEEILMLVFAHHQLKLRDCYTFSIEELSILTSMNTEIIHKIVDEFSFSTSSLTGNNKEFFFLDNPVWSKPIIRYDDVLICYIPQLFFAYSHDCFINLTKGINKEKVKRTKAKYLEDKIEEIILRRFPESQTKSGLEWSQDGREYETDLVTFIDGFMLIIEAKSHKVNKAALRGAPKTVKRQFDEMIIEPNIQSKRLRDKILYLKDNPDTEDTLREQLPVSLDDINNVIRMSITLEDFGTMQTNIDKFHKTDWMPNDYEPCVSMTVSDFECITDILEHPIEIINYLTRRSNLSNRVNILGDELDYLGLYCKDRLSFSNEMMDESTEVTITGMSSKIDQYFQLKEQGIDCVKPRPEMIPFFKDILAQIERRTFKGWTDLGNSLCMLNLDEQKTLLRMYKDLERNVPRTFHIETHNNMIIYTPNELSDTSICIIVYKNDNSSKRQDYIEHAVNSALEAMHVNNVMVIAKNIDTASVYNAVAHYKR